MTPPNASRTERDFLGERELPADAYYGIQTLRAVENFPITGYRIHWALIRAMATVKKSAALANMEAGFLEESLARAISSAADEMIEGKFNTHFIVDPIQGGAGTSFNMNANEVLANRALELLGREKGLRAPLAAPFLTARGLPDDANCVRQVPRVARGRSAEREIRIAIPRLVAAHRTGHERVTECG
jgi:hypothetical protein